MQTQNTTYFEEEGVAVTFSPCLKELSVRKALKPRQLPDLRNKEDGPEPWRVVIELEFYDKTGEVPSWDGWVRLSVRYNPADVEHAGGLQKLRLYYYLDNQWRAFTDQHDFHLVPDLEHPYNGVGIAYLDSWEDPPIGWDA